MPYLKNESQYELNIDISNIKVTTNTGFNNTPISISNKIILTPTRKLGIPIIQQIESNKTSCLITLSGIDNISINDLSYITFVYGNNDIEDTTNKYTPYTQNGSMYITISGLIEGNTYDNAYLKAYYKGDNIITSEWFSFTTSFTSKIYNINTTYTLHDIVVDSNDTAYITGISNESGILYSFILNTNSSSIIPTIVLDNNVLRQPEYCCIDNNDSIYICSRFVGNGIGSTVTKYNNSNSTYFVIAGTSNNNTTPSGTGSSTFNQPLGVFVYNNFLFTCNKDMGEGANSAIFYKDISGITINSNTIGTSIDLKGYSTVGQGRNEGIRDVSVDNSNIYYIETNNNNIYYMTYTVNANRTITFGLNNRIDQTILSGFYYRNIIVDNNRNIYVTVTNNSSNSSKIIKLTNNNGSYTSSEVTIGVLGNVVTLSSQIRGISFNKTYTILYIVDSGNNRVVSIPV
jgi:hypothetical protein